MSAERSFGDWLRQHRRALDLTQEELARQVGCSAITLRKLEAEERRPSKQIAERLAEVLQVPPAERADFLRFARGDPFAAPATIAAADPAAAVPAAAVTSAPPPAPQHNLPLQLTSFIGREKEIEAIRHLLATARLVTLTGAGGSGKTRLALQVAAALTDESAYPDGVWLIELAPLADPALVPHTVAAVLGVRVLPGQSPAELLISRLRPKRLLLLLDNCEHLIQASAELAQALLQACPHLNILATSRESMNIPGEATFVVPTLSVPAAQPNVLVEALAGYEAARLFVERAAAALPGFVVTPDNAAAVAQICRQLDGIPLAIELAAARMKVLSVEQIVARLDDRFSLLTGGSRTARPRQQTLQALIDWSYELLPVSERLLLQRLSVFKGGWNLEAAAAVCSDDVLRASQVLDRLEQLVNKSLVVAERPLGYETRYRMLETIRLYAYKILEAGGQARAAQARQAAHFGAITESDLSDRTLALEQDNFRAALDWAQSNPADADLGLRLAHDMSFFWWADGHWIEAQRRLETALAHPGAANYPLSAAKAHMALGNILHNLSDYTAAQAHLLESQRLFQSLQIASDEPRILFWLGILARERGDAPTARRLFEQCLAGLAPAAPSGARSSTLNSLGEVAVMQEDAAMAAPLLAEALRLSREADDANDIGWTLNHLGHLAQLQGDYGLARRLHAESLMNFQKVGPRFTGLAWAQEGLGETALAQNDCEHAAAHLRASLVAFRELGDRAKMCWCLAGLAGAAALDEEPERAARLWGAAESLRKAIGSRPAPAARATRERLMAAARDELGDAAFDAAWAEGQALTLEQAVAEALMNS